MNQLAIPVVILFGSAATAAPTAQVVFSFKRALGEYPVSGLFERAHHYFLALPGGGKVGCALRPHTQCGTLVRLEPPSVQGGNWRAKLLHQFLPAGDGSIPLDSPIADRSGNLFLTTWKGGPDQGGSLVEFTPPALGTRTWTESTVHNFDAATDGQSPWARPHIDSLGNIFVTTAAGLASNNGSLVEFVPPQGGATRWTEIVVHAFTGAPTDGAIPEDSVKTDAIGNMYLTTVQGGSANGGTVVEFLPNTGGTGWTEQVLYSFLGGQDGAGPLSGLLLDTQGDLFGLTVAGGRANAGTVYELVRPATIGQPWTEKVLYQFSDGSDGGYPIRGVVKDSAGNLFVLTNEGGGGCNCGTLVELSPPQGSQTAWSETTLYQFPGGSGGNGPSEITVENNGNFLVTTTLGGQYGGGAIVEFTNTGYVVK